METILVAIKVPLHLVAPLTGYVDVNVQNTQNNCRRISYGGAWMETTRMYDSDRLICVASLTGVRGWKPENRIQDMVKI